MRLVNNLDRNFLPRRDVLGQLDLRKVSFSYRLEQSVFSYLFFGRPPSRVVSGTCGWFLARAPTVVAVVYANLHIWRPLSEEKVILV